MKYDAAMVIVCIGLCALLLVACSSCCSARATNQPPGDTELVIANQRAASHLEAAVDYLEATASASHQRIGEITKTGATIADAVDRLEYLFGCYEREVNELLAEIDALRADLEKARASYPSGSDIADFGNPSESGDPAP